MMEIMLNFSGFELLLSRMRKVVPFLLLMLYGVAMVRPMQPLLDYYLRYELYAKKLCLNLARPEMKCNGQCILMQRLKKASEEQAPQVPNGNLVNLKDYPIGIIQTHEQPFGRNPIERGAYAWIASRIIPGFSKDVFHPPSFC